MCICRRVSALSLQIGGSTDYSIDSRPCEETKLLSLPILQSSKRAIGADALGSSSGSATLSSFEAQLHREIDKVRTTSHGTNLYVQFGKDTACGDFNTNSICGYVRVSCVMPFSLIFNLLHKSFQ